MGRIVTVNVVDLTRPVAQEGFKKVALVDIEAAADGMNEAALVFDATAAAAQKEGLGKHSTAFFANGGVELFCAATKCATAEEVKAALDKVYAKYEFYGLIVACTKANQPKLLGAVKEWVEAKGCLLVVEINGTEQSLAATAINARKGEEKIVEGKTAAVANSVIKVLANSDRVIAYANKTDVQNGCAAAVAGVCFPQDEGSLTWGNKVVTGVIESGYNAADELILRDTHSVNYITREKELILSQFGRTTSGSNADVTRSKDWLEARCAEALTATLVNSKKIPFTTEGMGIVSASLSQVGVQGVNMDMLDSFRVQVPQIEDIPTNDKANRVLRGVKFIATLSGAVETIEMELQVTL